MVIVITIIGVDYISSTIRYICILTYILLLYNIYNIPRLYRYAPARSHVCAPLGALHALACLPHFSVVATGGYTI